MEWNDVSNNPEENRIVEVIVSGERTDISVYANSMFYFNGTPLAPSVVTAWRYYQGYTVRELPDLTAATDVLKRHLQCGIEEASEDIEVDDYDTAEYLVKKIIIEAAKILGH